MPRVIHFPTARQEDRIDRYEKHAEPIRCSVDGEVWPCKHVREREKINA